MTELAGAQAEQIATLRMLIPVGEDSTEAPIAPSGLAPAPALLDDREAGKGIFSKPRWISVLGLLKSGAGALRKGLAVFQYSVY